MLTITKEFVFHAAHRLFQKDLSMEENRAIYGKCCDLHGHTYRLRVAVSGETGKGGMVMPFAHLKKIAKNKIISRYDHVFLNDLEEFFDLPTTVENMVVHIFRVLEECLEEKDVTLVSVTLFETPTSWATMTGPDLAQRSPHASAPRSSRSGP